MSSITEHEEKIKALLLPHVDELVSLLARSVTEQRTAHDVEQGLWQQMLNLGHHSLDAFFQQCGSGDEGEVVELATGHQVKRLTQPHRRPYLTVFGEFTLSRCVYGSREGQKIEHVPLDTRLQLPERKFSYLLADWNQAMATDLPFGKVSEHLSRLLNFRQSVNSLECSSRQLSRHVDAFWADQVKAITEQASPSPCGVLQESPMAHSTAQTAQTAQTTSVTVLSGDGKGVIMRPSELDAPPGNAKTTKRPGNKKMALIGSVYTAALYPRTPEQVLSALFTDRRVVDAETLSPRPEPLNKWVRGALLRNDQGKTDPQSDVIFSWLAAQARQRQTNLSDDAKALVLLMDGQESLWNAGLKHLPEQQFTVTEVLDLIHATQYVWTATHLFYPKGSARAASHAREQIGQLLNNQVNTVINEWRSKAVKEHLSPAAHDALETVCGYFTNHAHRMRYKDYLEQGWPVASGVIEGACRHVVKDRMEHSGMRWTMKGAHAMLELRSVQLSGLWDEFMQFWRLQENRRLYPATQAANDGVFEQLRRA